MFSMSALARYRELKAYGSFSRAEINLRANSVRETAIVPQVGENHTN